ALVVRAEVVARDEDAVGMGMVVQVHVLGLGERRLHGVSAGRPIGGIPIDHGRPRGHVQRVAFRREPRVVERASALLLLSVDLSLPPRYGDTAAGRGTRDVLSPAWARHGDAGEGRDGSERESGVTTHGVLRVNGRWQ